MRERVREREVVRDGEMWLLQREMVRGGCHRERWSEVAAKERERGRERRERERGEGEKERERESEREGE